MNLEGSGVGQVVSVLAVYFNKLSSNPAHVYSYFCKICVKRTKINKRGRGPLLKVAKHCIKTCSDYRCSGLQLSQLRFAEKQKKILYLC